MHIYVTLLAGIPMMILMTKVDKLDQIVSDSTWQVNHSTEVRDAMESLSSKTGVPMSYIMPVKSYERETELEPAIDILTLTALRQMLRLADDFFEDQMDMLGITPGSDSDTDTDEKTPRAKDEETPRNTKGHLRRKKHQETPRAVSGERRET